MDRLSCVLIKRCHDERSGASASLTQQFLRISRSNLSQIPVPVYPLLANAAEGNPEAVKVKNPVLDS
jgi:hypothetical protein